MSTEESDDEPLAVLAAAKKQDPNKYSQAVVIETSVDYVSKPKKKKTKNKQEIAVHTPITISLTRKQQYQISRPVVQRPEDVWLYLKDFNQVGPYSCLLCSEWFISKGKIVIHYILNHKKDFCGICRYFVKDRQSWTVHSKFHTPWPCSQCGNNFYTEEELKDHLASNHNLVHCRLCHFRVSKDEQYNNHLAQKHSVTNVACKNEEFLWQLETGSQKFQCLLCLKSNNLPTTFLQHYMGFHHYTLKCFTTMISGQDFPFTVLGADISQEFIETLNNHGKVGYVDLDPNINVFGSDQDKQEQQSVLKELLLDVKLEAISENEEGNENEPESNENLEAIKTYKGQEDFDVTLMELIMLERNFYDYLNQSLTDINANILPPNSYIQYEKSKSDVTTQITCPLCLTMHTVLDFTTHMCKAHCVKSKPIYTCRVCANTFENQNELDNHVDDEMGDFEDLWLCQFCDKEFDDRQASRVHLTEHWDLIEQDNCFSPHLGFKCKYCPTLFWNEPERENHHIKEHLNKQKRFFYKCECGETFSDKVWFVYHIYEKHHKEDQHCLYKCCLCTLVLPTVDLMRSHFKFEHPSAKKMFCSLDTCQYRPLSHKKSFQLHLRYLHQAKVEQEGKSVCTCNICGREFPTPRARGAHVTQVHGPGKFKCKMCPEMLHSMDERKLHYLISHPGRHPFECAECGKSFQYKSSLYMHKTEHSPNKQKFTCQYCQKVFAKKDSFREHVQIHEGPRHACSYCPARFVQRSNMLRHERRHTGERPYSCPHCARTFADKGACTSHVRTHSKEASYACLYCGQTFAQKSKLTYHIRKHTGENLETCGVCSKLFTSHCSLKEHMKTHANERKDSVKCPLCEKKYRDERYMLRHLRTSHTNNSYSCPLCRKPFTSALGLRYHVMTHSRLNMFRCKFCPKSYAVKRTILRHLRRRHGLVGTEINVKDFYTKLDPRESNIDLDEATMTKIFGPPKKKLDDVLIGDFVTYTDTINAAKKATNTAQEKSSDEEDNGDEENQESQGIDHEIEPTIVNIKIEPQDYTNNGQELEPTDFVSVKIEPMDEEEDTAQ